MFFIDRKQSRGNEENEKVVRHNTIRIKTCLFNATLFEYIQYEATNFGSN